MYACAVGPDFILMDGNALIHRDHITNRYLEEATKVRMDWPARSPDLNPFAHAWDMLQKAISLRHAQPTTDQELRHAIIEEWAQIFQGPQTHQQHAAAMPGRYKCPRTPYSVLNTLFQPFSDLQDIFYSTM
jgi:hypothetical protein